MALTLEDAIRKSIKAYFAGLEPSELKAASGKKGKYSKKYFDKVAEDNNIKQDIPDFSSDGSW